MLSDPVMGQPIVCCDPEHPRYGWTGLVRGWNSKRIGVEFVDDADCPPTGRWFRKHQISALATINHADSQLLEAIQKVALVRSLLTKARESALLAVETYNKPAVTFRSGAYVVLMIIAWTSAFLAHFHRRGEKPFYREQDGSTSLVDGRPKCCELEECVRRYWGSHNSPVRDNLRLFIGLRNQIEHSSMPQLDATVFGHCQAMLLNFEEFMAREFGERYLLTDTLAYSLQFSRRSPPERQKAMTALPGSELKDVLDYVEQFHNSLSPDILNSQEFCFKAFLIPQLLNNPPGCFESRARGTRASPLR